MEDKGNRTTYLTKQKQQFGGKSECLTFVCVDTNAVAADLCDVCHVTGFVHRSPNQRLSQLSQ